MSRSSVGEEQNTVVTSHSRVDLTLMQNEKIGDYKKEESDNNAINPCRPFLEVVECTNWAMNTRRHSEDQYNPLLPPHQLQWINKYSLYCIQIHVQIAN